jgi:hypothetical protein
VLFSTFTLMEGGFARWPSSITSRESLAIAVDQGIKAEQVAAVLERTVNERGVPKSIRLDNVLNLFRKFWTDGLTSAE